jgi:hypothetical protein
VFRAQDVLCAAEDAASIATFLIHMPGLDKKMIGEYLGDPAELSVNTLREYVEAIGLPTFPRLGFDDALRMFLQGFRLPGCARPRPLPTHAMSSTSRANALFRRSPWGIERADGYPALFQRFAAAAASTSPRELSGVGVGGWLLRSPTLPLWSFWPGCTHVVHGCVPQGSGAHRALHGGFR